VENNEKRNSKLFLHIGLHKTGTSSIQTALIQNKNNLINEGIFYFNDLNFFNNILHNDIFSNKLLNKCIIQLENISKTKKNTIQKIIISNEAFSGNPFNGYKNIEIIIKYLSEIGKRFDTKIILYLRRQDELMESLYIQSIKEGETLIFEDFIKTLKYDSFNWSNYIRVWMQNFSKNQLIVRMYDKKTLKNGDIVSDFANIIESQLLKNDNNYYEENKRYSQGSLEVARMLNQYLNDNDKKYVRSLLEKINTKIRFDSFALFTKKGRKKVLSYFKKCNTELLNDFPFLCSREFFKTDVESDKPVHSYLEKSKNYNHIISDLISSLINENTTLKYKTKPSLKNLYRMLIYILKKNSD
tara:strand:- start:2882 stop:3949 length:1068 start_codon:yes stop_codon:yes gene_type:complete